MGFKEKCVVGLAAVCSLGAVSAMAGPVTGMANIAGSVTVSETTIDFNPIFTVPPGAMNTGSFSDLTGGTVNAVLTGGPASGSVNDKNFMTFHTPSGNIDFDLTNIQKGNGPDDSPFTFTQAGSNVLVGLSFDGSSYFESTPSQISPTSGVFSTQLLVPGASIQDVIQSVESGNAITGQTYSATFTATNMPPSEVPEPTTYSLLGLGLVAAGVISRKVRS